MTYSNNSVMLSHMAYTPKPHRPGHSALQIHDWPDKLRKSLKIAAARQGCDYRDLIIEAAEQLLERFKKGGK